MIQVEPDDASFRRVERALRTEADSGALGQDLAEEFHQALEPAVSEVRGAVLGMPTGGLPHAGEGLRAAVASHIQTDIRVGKRGGGALIRALKRGMPRGFVNAPKRLNARRGWRHQLWGRDQWAQQLGEPGWFDDTLARGRGRYLRAAAQALEKVSRRIARR
jgi:hypothetical protein